MINIYLAIVIVIITAVSLLGMAVFVRSPKVAINRAYILFAASVSIWMIANYVSNDTSKAPSTAVISNYFVFFFSYFTAVSLLYFAIGLTQDAQAKKLFKRFLLPIIAVAAISFTPLLVKGVEVQDSLYAVQFGPAIPLYFITLIGLIVWIIYVLRKNLKRTTGKLKAQIRVAYLSFVWTLPALALMLMVVPVATGWFGLTNIGVLPMAFLAFGLYYGAFRHKLFDLRIVIARSLGYVFSVGLLVASFGLISTLVVRNIFAGQPGSLTALWVEAALFACAVIIYAPVKQFFDRITGRIFFRDIYDPQVFLDKLNKTLVGNIEIGILLRHTALVIEENLKADCHIYVSETDLTPARIMGSSKMNIKEGDLKFIFNEIGTIPNRVVVADDLGEQYSSLYGALNSNEIAVLSCLMTSYSTSQEATAYLILGPKKSGNAYSKQDIRIINIITDELLIAIQNALRFEEIQSFNITLQNRINDATAKLKRSNEKLKELDETKDEFISMASHQLRTPLTSVKGYLSMVLDGDAGKVTETQQQLLNQAYVSSQRMVYLIADLLNVSRLKTGKFVINATPTNLADMVESEIAQLTEVAKGRKLKLTYDKPKDFPELMLDETKTRQVVMNFVDNAIYYTPSGGKIKIELRADRSSVYFMVKDNGLGVPKGEQPHMFTKFYRAKNAQKARPDGTGLGLFMAKKVINDQGGAILFESVEGKGSTFGFKFDLPRDHDKK